ncbi:MAG: polymer-forming cytoskeletal protein [Deltaproteobacteria bacterium]|nr:polymer-forming cytoskeletal protein [Sandaracinaceae bacterium]MCX7808774.1 polymer-forming cytoskeletal protein [Deltaproteobacteria bacterium]MDW8245839.1 polymer-forming cytoskeletal protein [Sandaracinaceae bacterium]
MSQEIRALIGRGTRFVGKLLFEEHARIEGHLEGEIFGRGVLVLGEGAEVHATIEVDTLIVRAGVLKGTVRAHQLVEIHPDAKVYGDIFAPLIDIAKGSVVEGKCVTTSPSSHEASTQPLSEGKP